MFPFLGASPSVFGIPESIIRMLELPNKDKRTDKTHLDPLSTETAHLGWILRWRYHTHAPPEWCHHHYYRTRVRSLFTLVSNWLTHSLTHSCLVNLIDVTLACEDDHSNLLRLLLLLMLMMRNVLTTVWCRFWNLKFFVQTLRTRFDQDFEVEVQARFASAVWPAFFC